MAVACHGAPRFPSPALHQGYPVSQEVLLVESHAPSIGPDPAWRTELLAQAAIRVRGQTTPPSATLLVKVQYLHHPELSRLLNVKDPVLEAKITQVRWIVLPLG
ncbi:hypothetical protein NDU88_006256 [Pleurodeles waltl]|uniref:Uncharacterized protein n=1 Tax=Pleurodeles waltl TaxID=8319 RepID=A0AAV7ULE7_PLEWA|nr:hypothetical protein NDU88_006256 [Pleurodeles waltl]